MGKRNIDNETLRLLYAHSGNCCAFEGCHNPIFEDDGTLTGECCHIEAFSPKGARYNSHQSDEERNGYDNLILMCSRHHKIVDRNPEQYSVEKLKEMKRTHEKQFYAKQLEVTDMMLNQLQHDSERYWDDLRWKDEDVCTELKIMVEEQDIPSLMEEIKDVYALLWNNIEEINELHKHLSPDLKDQYWEIVKLGFPNCMALLKMRYLQLCVMMLEKIVKHDMTHYYVDLLNTCRRELKMMHEDAYYAD